MANPFSAGRGGGSRSNPFGGGGGDSGSAEARLRRAVGNARETGDEGLFGFAKNIADKVGLDTAGNVVMRGLDIADMGRAGVVSGLSELMDGLSELTGGESDIEGTDRVRQTGFSWEDFKENFNNRVGFGDLLEADESTRDLPLNAKRVLGFLGDVAADPLTYVTAGASQGARGGRMAAASGGRRTLLATDDVAERLVRAGDDAAAEAVAGGRSVAAIPREALPEGVDRGIYFAGHRVKALDGVYDSMSRARGQARARVAEAAVSRLRPETIRRLERVPGVSRIRQSPELRRQGIANVTALKYSMAWRDSGVTARNLRAEYGSQLQDIFDRFRDVDRDTLRQGLEGAAVDNPAVAEMRSFFDNIVRDVNQATGSTIPTLDQYLSHQLTDEAKEALGKRPGRGAAGAAGFTRKRDISKTIDQANEDFRRFLEDSGREGVDLFRTDPWEIGARYLDQVERFVRFKSFERGLVDMGIARHFNYKAVRKALKHNKGRRRAIKQLGKEAERAESRRGRKIREAERVAGDIAKSPFSAPSLDRALQTGADSVRARLRGDQLDEALVDLDDTLATLGDERQILRERLAGALNEDPQDAITRLEGEVDELRTNQGAARAEAGTAGDEAGRLEQLRDSSSSGDLDEAIIRRDQAGSSLEEVGRQLKAAQARARRAAKREPEELSIRERKLAALQRLRDEGAPERAITQAEQAFREDGTDQLLRQIEQRYDLPTSRPGDAEVQTQVAELTEARDAAKAEHRSLIHAVREIEAQGGGQSIPDDLADQIMNARRRVGAAKGRATKAEKAVQRRLETIERHQAVLETEYAVKGDVRPLVDRNRERLGELRGERRTTATQRNKARREELRLRERADSLYEQAKTEQDPRLAIQARFEAQARQAEADMLMARAGQYREAMSMRAIKTEDLKLAEAVAKDQLASINRHGQLWADPDVARAITDLQEMFKPATTGRLLRLHDQVMSRWKAYSLLSPGYHFRNGYSAMFMNEVAGYTGGAQGYRRFGHLWRRATQDGIDEALRGVNAEYAQQFRQAWEWRGALFNDQGIRDLADVQTGGASRRGLLGEKAMVRGRNLDPTSLDNVALQANTRMAERVERLVRGPLFIDGLQKGMSPEEAYARVVRFHFDYSEGISRFERDVMRRIVPFYTWTRLNFPLQLEYMARNPGVYTKYTHAKRNIEHGSEEEPIVPQYLGELGAIALPVAAQGGRMYASPDLPHLRLGQTFDRDQLLSNLTPLIKTPMELDRDRRFFNDIPFSDEYVEVPDTWLGVGPLLEIAGGKFGLPKVEQVDGRYFFANEGEAYKVEQALPLLGRLRRLAPSEERYQKRQLTSWLSFGLGLTSATNSEDAQRSELMRREQEINDLVDAYARRQRARGEEV